MTKNDIIQLTIDDYSSSGEGVAHHEGRAVFIPFALVGERVSARILKVTKKAVYAKIEEIIDPSPYRIEADCPHFRKCGSCSLLHMDYEEELRYKHGRITEALRRIGGVEYDFPPIVPSPQISGYRNKAIFQIGYDGDKPLVGFFRQRSHDIINVQECEIQSPRTTVAAGVVHKWMVENPGGGPSLRYLFCRVSADGQLQVVIVSRHRKIKNLDSLVEALKIDAKATSILLCVNDSTGNVVLNDDIRTLYGPSHLEDVMCGFRFSLAPGAFYQVNHSQGENIYSYAAKLADLNKNDTAVDLYCGAGTITLVLARNAGHVIGVEIVKDAVDNARSNSLANDIANVEFIQADAVQAAQILSDRNVRPRVLVVDPPRKGLGQEVVDGIVKMAPDRIVYVSCDPATLARDVNLLKEHGYAFREGKGFDMFARCGHVETVVLMSRVDK